MESSKNNNLQFILVALGLSGIAAFYINQKNQNLQKQTSLQKNKQICIGIELGGTSIKISFGEKYLAADRKINEIKVIENTVRSFETKDPESTVAEITNYIKEIAKNYQQIDQIGIASFGPICLNKNDTDYGKITTTPKLKWINFPIVEAIKKQLNFFTKEIAFDTDVNAPAMAEYKLGNHKVKESLVYVTIGTGVGIGLIVNGTCVHGLMHPEGGHMNMPLNQKDKDDNFPGVCSYHGNKCLEGLISNVSIAKRLNCTKEQLIDLKDDHWVWDIISEYLAIFCANLAYVLSPEVIILGGGVMNRTILFNKIHEKLPKILNGYLVLYKKESKDFVKPPSLGKHVGVIGAMIL